MHTFDASLSADPSGLLGNGAAYKWDFGDGKSATGQIVTHDYAKPGDYNVTLTVTEGGKSDAFDLIAQDTDPTLLALRFPASGPDDISSHDLAIELLGKPAAQTAGSYTLTDDNFLRVDRTASLNFHALSEFTLSFDLQRGGGSQDTGRILGIKTSWIVAMDKEGHIVFDVTNSDGKSYTLASGAKITDTKWHDITIEYSDKANLAEVHIDGQLSGSVAVDGPTPAYHSYGLTVGWPWGGNFNGHIRDIDLIEGTGVDPLPGSGSGGGVPPSIPDIALDTSAPDTKPDADLAAIVDAIAAGAYQKLATDLSVDLVTDGKGGKGDEVVLASSHGKHIVNPRGGDNVAIGDDHDNWLVDGKGDNVLWGGDGADFFRFKGGLGTDTVLDIDFTEGDRIKLAGFDKGTFQDADTSDPGLRTFAKGSAATILSLDGLKDLRRGRRGARSVGRRPHGAVDRPVRRCAPHRLRGARRI